MKLKNLTKLTYALAIALIPWSLAISEQLDEEGQQALHDPIVVSARKYPTTVSKTPGGIGVVSADQIFEQQPLSVSNISPRLPGVDKASDSPWGSEINIRGLSRESVVLLIDDARVNTATDLGARFGLIDPREVERVEVLKGPISSLYGSGSIGGIVNVITKNGAFTDQPATERLVSLQGESNPLGGGAYARAVHNSESWYLYTSQSYRSHNSYYDGSSDKVDNSQFEDYQSALKGGLAINDNNSLHMQVQHFEGNDIGIPGTGSAPLPLQAEVTYPRTSRTLVQGRYVFTPQNGLWKSSELNLYYQAIDRRALIDRFPTGAPLLAVAPSADHETWGSKWTNEVRLARHTLIGGLDLWERSFDSTRTTYFVTGMARTDEPLPEASYRSTGLFLEDALEIGNAAQLSLGARYDVIYVDNENNEIWEAEESTDRTWNAHAGLSYQLSDQAGATLLAARGYRAASLEERYQFLQLGSGAVKVGNPDLDPERSFFTEADFHWVGERGTITLSGYYNDLKELIIEQQVADNLFTNQNIGEAYIYGFEAEARAFVTDRFELFANLAFARGKDRATHEDLPNISPLNGLTGLRHVWPGGFWTEVELVFAAKQDDVPAENLPTAGWAVFNARAGYNYSAWGLQQRLILGINNIFDKSYRQYLTTSRGFELNEPGLSVLGAYQVAF